MSKIRLPGLLFLVGLTAACTDLRAVNEWSKTSLEAAQYSEIVTTYANTPLRLKRYNPPNYNAEDQFDRRTRQAKAMNDLLRVVSDYMAALQVLSADETIDYDDELGSLQKAVGKLDVGLSDAELGAVGSIAETLLNAGARAYRARAVSDVIEQANGPLQAILSGQLRRIVDDDFREDLEIEKAFMRAYYKNDLLRSGRGSKMAKAAVEEWFDFRRSQNSRRLAALDAYLRVIDKIAAGHQKIYESRKSLDAAKLAKALFADVKVLRKQIAILAGS